VAIPVVPLASLVVLLALFFPLAGMGEGGLDAIALPPSRHAVPARPDSAWIVVAPGEGGGVRYLLLDPGSPSREITGIEALAVEAARILEADPSRAFVVRADARLRYGLLDEILERLRDAGARSLLLETAEPER
jgi:biopolymer transport protein ExbD